jgi:hypothetical protein
VRTGPTARRGVWDDGFSFEKSRTDAIFSVSEFKRDIKGKQLLFDQIQSFPDGFTGAGQL